MGGSNALPRSCGRILLRKLESGDLVPFQRYRADPEVARFQGWEAMSDGEAASFLEAMNGADFPVPGDWYQLGVADRASGRLIGDIGIRVDSREKEAEIGFSLSREHQGRGLGGEAVREAIRLVFERTRVGRIVGITDERNRPSIGLMTRVGMRGVDRVETVFRGEPCTELVFVVDRS